MTFKDNSKSSILNPYVHMRIKEMISDDACGKI